MFARSDISDCIKLASQWLATCVFHDSQCARNVGSPLPTRVVNVKNPTPVIDSRIYVTSRECERYVALSHCWGRRLPLRTTQANLLSHERRIPIGELPQTFRDAVSLVRQLGLRYLWIDALYIVQDDEVDWEKGK